jgi:hypothetical protein
MRAYSSTSLVLVLSIERFDFYTYCFRVDGGFITPNLILNSWISKEVVL